MDLPLTRLYSARAAPRGSPVPLAAFPAPLPLFAASTAHRTPLTPPPIVSPISPAADRLDDLMREQAVLAHLKANVPMIWEMVESEIHSLHLSRTPSRAQRLPHHARLPAHSSPMPPAAPRAALPVALGGARGAHASGGAGARKRVKLPVPAEKYPDYNFVGRLLGPRGTTLKKLERDTGCKIMIRGRGSIRKDKELEVRGKAGWEHVFNESLHVVIEVCDAVDDSDAARVLTRAKEMVELLLVPMPEDRDTLKRQQLRVLAILNGTFRASDAHRCSPAQSPRPAAAGHAAVFTAGSGRAAAAHLIPSGGDFGIIGSAVGIGSAVSIGSALSIGETPSM